MQTEGLRDERVKQVVVAATILMSLMVAVAGTLLGWRLLPGVFGEWVGTVIGIMTTPFFMEGTFIVLGLVTVITINTWRRQKDGDEFVYLEQVTGPDVPSDLPDQAKWAVYREMPLPAVALPSLAKAEGALAIGDFQAATEWIGAMSHEELQSPDALKVRLELAKATGRNDLIQSLEDKIRNGS